MKQTKYIIFYYFLLFLFLYLFTLNFNYVEGDDAATILYHLCGRNPLIEQPYASYNSGLDFLIELTNYQSEESLRNFAVLVSFISGFLVLVLYALFLDVFFEGNKEVNVKNRIYLYILLPFIVPDIIFHSLLVNSTNISFVFLLCSLILFIKFLKSNRNILLIFSTILFAIAIPFRWTMFIALPLYMGLALYFYPIQYYSKDTFKLFVKTILANLLGVILAILFIYVTGYNLQGIYETIQSTTGYLENSEKSLLSILATGSAFLTPSLLILIFMSFFKIHELDKKQPKTFISIISFVLLSISPFILFGFFPSYKFLITLFPMLLILMVFGIDYLFKRKWLKIVFLIAVMAPWFIGIQLDVTGSFCGPGFELNTNKKIQSDTEHIENPDKRIKIEGINLKFNSGFYMPMLEGPRPLYGYFYAIFVNGWKNQIDLFTQERQKIIDLLLNDENIIFIQDRKTAYIQCDLYRNGFSTQTNFINKKDYSYRNFKKNDFSIKMYVVPDNYSKSDWISNFLKTTKKTVIYRSSYSNDILQLYNDKENKIEIIGPFTVIKNAE